MLFVMIIVMGVVKIMILRRIMIMMVRVIETFIFIAKVKLGCCHWGT